VLYRGPSVYGHRCGWGGRSTDALPHPALPPRRSWVLRYHRMRPRTACYARAAKWDGASRQRSHGVGGGGELACDWPTVNDAVTTYACTCSTRPQAADHTTAIGWNENPSWARHQATPLRHHRPDVEPPQIIDIPPAHFTEVAAWIEQTSAGLERADPLRR